MHLARQGKGNCDKLGFADSSLYEVLSFDVTALFLQYKPVQGKDKVEFLRPPSVWDRRETVFCLNWNIYFSVVFQHTKLFSCLGTSFKYMQNLDCGQFLFFFFLFKIHTFYLVFELTNLLSDFSYKLFEDSCWFLSRDLKTEKKLDSPVMIVNYCLKRDFTG